MSVASPLTQSLDPSTQALLTYLPMFDGNGNVMGMIKASSGSIHAAYEYDAFGNTLRATGSYAGSNLFRFSTKFTDTETGLVYYGQRYYSPSLGRFINKDPIEEQGGLNLYGFCVNNGVNRWDYLGMDSQYADGNGSVGFAAGAGGPPRATSTTSIDAADMREADRTMIPIDGYLVSLGDLIRNSDRPISSIGAVAATFGTPVPAPAARAETFAETTARLSGATTAARPEYPNPGPKGALAFGEMGSPDVIKLEPFRVTAVAGEVALAVISIFFEPVDMVLTLREIHNEPRNPWSYVGMAGVVPTFAGKLGKAAQNAPGSYRPARPLPRDAHGNPVPEPGASGPHTQLGSQSGRNGEYTQAREFDADGRPVRDIDFTDHGRPDVPGHTNPHEHPYVPNPTGGTPQRGPAEPLK